MYKKQRAIEAASYFLWKAQRPLEKAKLSKLMYLSEREYLLSYGSLLTGDDFLCKKDGPDLAKIHDAFDSVGRGGDWNAWVSITSQFSTSDHNFLWLRKKIRGRGDFSHLSRAMLKVLDKIYAKYGQFDVKTLSNLMRTEAYCPEWSSPNLEEEPLEIKLVLLKNGKTEEAANIIMEDLAEQDSYDKMIFELNK